MNQSQRLGGSCLAEAEAQSLAVEVLAATVGLSVEQACVALRRRRHSTWQQQRRRALPGGGGGAAPGVGGTGSSRGALSAAWGCPQQWGCPHAAAAQRLAAAAQRLATEARAAPGGLSAAVRGVHCLAAVDALHPNGGGAGGSWGCGQRGAVRSSGAVRRRRRRSALRRRRSAWRRRRVQQLGGCRLRCGACIASRRRRR